MAICQICKGEIKERNEWLIEIYKPIVSIKKPFNEGGCVHLKCITQLNNPKSN